jgi:hypothetical protein
MLSPTKKPILSIDNTLTDSLQDEVRSGRQSLDNGVLLPLSKTDKSKIIYRKYEAQSPDLSDTAHREWENTLVAHPKIALLGMEDRLLDDDIIGVSEDDGLILHFKGEAEATVAIDMNNGRVLREEEAELLEETMDMSLPRYTEWCFRLDWVKLTNGPESRQKLAETYERQKNMEQAEMFNSMEQFFGKLMHRLEGMDHIDANKVAIEEGNIVDPQSLFQAMLKDNSPEQLKALIDSQDTDSDLPEPMTQEEIAEETELLRQEELAAAQIEEAGVTLEEQEVKPTGKGKAKKK